MKSYSLDHLAKPVLHRDSLVFHRNESSAMAMAIAHVGEIDARRSYRDEGYPSMLAFCEHVYELSEPAALKRIRVARLAREYPALFEALASRKLSLSCVILLSPYLTALNANELIAAAAHEPKSELEQLIAKWFPKQDVPSKLEAIAGPPPMLGDQLSPGRVGDAGAVGDAFATGATGATGEDAPLPGAAELNDQLSAQTAGTAADDQLCSRADETALPRPKLSPLSADRFALQLTVNRCTYDKLRYAQELLSHQLPSGDLVEVFDRALDALIAQLEKRKFAATSRPRRGNRRTTRSARLVPAQVKREVWVRDGGQCTFVSDAGHRCCARELLEFDHIEEVARGGKAAVAGVRLRCRGHNQFTAEQTFGAEFMKAKREEAQRVAQEKRDAKASEAATAREVARVAAEQAATAAWIAAEHRELEAKVKAERAATEARIAEEQREADAKVRAERAAADARIAAEQRAAEAKQAAAAAERAKELDVVPWLRALGFRSEEARRAAEYCETIPDASLEERVSKALAFLAPRARQQDFRRAEHREGAPA